MIDWDDMVDLVALAATYDQRKVSELDVKAWSLAAEMAGWDDARAVSRVIVEHYSRPLREGEKRGRVDPTAISTRLREITRRIMDSFVDPKIPAALPDGMTYPQWLRSQQEAHKREALRVWAITGEEPRPAAIEPMGNGLPAILAAAPDHVRDDLRASMTRAIERKS